MEEKIKEQKEFKKSVIKTITIAPVTLTPEQRRIIAIPTPKEFVKQRKGRGDRVFNYVEGGYTVARLNEIFSPVGWQFEIVDERVEAGEVVVRGKLTIKDYKTGYEVSKTQYGTKERYAGVPLGDTLKAASTDALKKCASYFGIALDVYWPDLDKAGKEETVKEKPVESSAPTKLTKQSLYDLTVDRINKETNNEVLYQMMHKIREAKENLYSRTAKDRLIDIIKNKLGVKDEQL